MAAAATCCLAGLRGIGNISIAPAPGVIDFGLGVGLDRRGLWDDSESICAPIEPVSVCRTSRYVLRPREPATSGSASCTRYVLVDLVPDDAAAQPGGHEDERHLCTMKATKDRQSRGMVNVVTSD